MQEIIFEARPQLVRLCRSLSGDAEAAEDLAQETLVEAWRGRDGLRAPEAAPAWLAGIARNVCRRHARRVAVGHAREAQVERETSSVSSDAWEELEREERAVLLDRAMGWLPEPARRILAARYWEERPLAEIAAQMQCAENTAAVRLGRAREALREVLGTRLRAEAEAFGLTDVEHDGWRVTRVWCFRCGRRRLEEHHAEGKFEVRCADCDGTAAEMAFSTRHAAMDSLQVLGQVQTCKPALRRINAWWDTRLRRGLRDGKLPCWRCAGVMTRPPCSQEPTERAGFGHRAAFHCGKCGADFSLPASGLAFHSDAVQRFWQQHPRMQVRPERRVETGRAAKIITRYEAVGSPAALEIVYDALTFRQDAG